MADALRVATAASTEFKRLFAQTLAWDAEDAATTFYEALKSAARARVRDTATGKVLISTSANGKSATWQLPMGSQGITPVEIASICSELLDRYERARLNLVARGDATPDDATIFAELLALLIPCRETHNDFVGLRFYGRSS